MATLVLVTVAMRVLFTRECFRQRSGHTDKPVLNVCANLHMYKMKLLPVWGPRLYDESSCVEHFHSGGNHQHVDHATNILVFSRVQGHLSSCAIEQIGTDALSRLCRSPADPYCFKTSLRRSSRAQTWHKLCDDTMGNVLCGHEGYGGAYYGVAAILLHTRRKTRSSNKGLGPKNRANIA